jgi:hypothetical protein
MLNGKDHRRQQQSIGSLGVQDGRDVLLGHNHYVDLGLGFGMVEGKHPVVLPDLVDIQLA